MARCAAALGLVLCFGSTTLAQAPDPRELGDPAGEYPAEPPPQSPGPLGLDWTFDISAQASFPLSIGLEAQLGTPIGITASFGGGHTPAAYLEAITGILRDVEVIQPNVEPLVDDLTASGAWNLRAGLGLTIREGLEIGGGYTYLWSDSVLSSNALQSASGTPFSFPAVPMSLRFHAWHARLGWRVVILDHIVIRLALGWTHVVSSEVNATLPPELDPPGGTADQIEDQIEEGVNQYGFTPEVLLSLGYRI